jgi:DNA anti-recombination protein RmuC
MSDEEESKGLELDIGGMKVNFRSYWLAIILPVVTAAGGALWGGFELWTQFLAMKEATEAYVSPDLSSYDNRIAVLFEKMETVEKVTGTNKESLDVISTSLTTSVSNAVRTADAVDARARSLDRETQSILREMQNEIRQFDRETQQRLKEIETNVTERLAKLSSEVDDKIQKTLANPLSGNN